MSHRTTGDEYWDARFGSYAVDDAVIQTVAIVHNAIYAGGSFTIADGEASPSGIARWDGQKWRSMPGVTYVRSIAADDTTVFAAGDLGILPGKGMRVLSMWDGGSWTDLVISPSPASIQILALCLLDDDVYVGGSFQAIGGIQANGIAVYHRSTHLWEALGTGIASGVNQGLVTSLVAIPGYICAGGAFTQAGQSFASNVARWNIASHTWESLGSGTNNGVNGRVDDIAAKGSDILVSGTFQSAGTIPADNIALWTASSGTWSSLAGGPGMPVDRIWADEASDILAVCSLPPNAGASLQTVRKFDGNQWSVFIDTVDGSIGAITSDGPTILIAGSFSSIGGTRLNNIGTWSGSDWRPLGLGMGGGTSAVVSAMAFSGQGIVAGGTFEKAGGKRVLNIGTLDPADASWNWLQGSLYPTPVDVARGLTGEVYAVAPSGNNVYIGGFLFGTGGHIVVHNIVLWNTSESSWHLLSRNGSDTASGTNGTVRSIAVQGSSVYVGGEFTVAGDLRVLGIARWDTAAHSWFAIDAALANLYSRISIDAIVVAQGQLFISGLFEPIAGVPFHGILRYEQQVWYPVTKRIDGAVHSMAADGDLLYVGGEFTTIEGLPVGGIARYTISRGTWSAVGDPASQGVNGTVNAIAIAGGSVFVGGSFTIAGNSPASNIACWNGRSWLPLGSGTDAEVYTLIASGSDVYAGGAFNTAGNKPSARIAHWDNSVLDIESVSQPRQLVIRVFPSPARGTVSVRFALPSGGLVSLRIVDLLGRQVAALKDESFPAGVNTITVDTRSFPHGMCLILLDSGTGTVTEKMIIGE